jgi:hypothetical protein
VRQTICPVCCGTKRQREIACPADCVYLASAREHPAAVVQRRQERDFRFYLPLVADLSEAQYRMLLLFQAIAVRQADGALPPLVDQDVAEAAGAVASTLETARKGIIYEHRPGAIPAQRLAAEFTRAVTEVGGAPDAPPALERDAAVVLRRLQQGAAGAAQGLAGDQPPVFLSLLRRLMAGGMPGSTDGQASEPAAPSIILP